LICTEGKTEAIYFGHYKSSTGPVVVALDKSDHKVSLVKKTIEERDVRIQAGEFDQEKALNFIDLRDLLRQQIFSSFR
jgi:hypothetical protein